MSVRKQSSSRREIILAFGESLNDSKSLATLAKGLRPDLPDISPREAPSILRRDAALKKRISRAEQIAKLVKGELAFGRLVRGVIAHRDLDNMEADASEDDCCDSGTAANSSELGKDIESAIREIKSDITIIPVVIAYEMEAWWFMWPEALSSYRPSWNPIKDYSGRRVDLIQNAKQSLRLALRPKKANGHLLDYTESDCPGIAQKIVDTNLAQSPKGISFSFSRFRKSLAAI